MVSTSHGLYSLDSLVRNGAGLCSFKVSSVVQPKTPTRNDTVGEALSVIFLQFYEQIFVQKFNKGVGVDEMLCSPNKMMKLKMF